MTARRLEVQAVERIWGRNVLPEPFSGCAVDGARTGEIWFRNGPARPGALLVKYLFTSERLSIQVHPDDRSARALGYGCGKDEAWLILEAEPGAVIGLGLKREVSAEALRSAALSGEIEQMIEWRPVRAGEIIYSPGGTIHAIGGGLSLVEIQQDLDLTFRLYDYGRPRELHLDEALSVASLGPYREPSRPFAIGDGRLVLAAGCAFVVERWSGLRGWIRATAGAPVTIIPLAAGGSLDGRALRPGSVWEVEREAKLEGGAGDLLVAYPGREAAAGLFVPAPMLRAAS